FQHHALADHARDDIEAGIQIAIFDAAYHFAAIWRIAHALDRYGHRLSGGNVRRAAFERLHLADVALVACARGIEHPYAGARFAARPFTHADAYAVPDDRTRHADIAPVATEGRVLSNGNKQSARRGVEGREHALDLLDVLAAGADD